MPDGMNVQLAQQAPKRRRSAKPKPVVSPTMQQLLDEVRATANEAQRLDSARERDDVADKQKADKAFEAAEGRFEAALQRFESAPITSLADVALRLEYATERADCNTPYIASLHKAVASARPFSPAGFAEPVIQALLPMIDGEDLAEGVTTTMLFEALKPFFGHFTVEDAVATYQFLDGVKESQVGERWEAVYHARETLLDFICRGQAASPACVSARAEILKNEDAQDIGDGSYGKLCSAVAHDIHTLRTNEFVSGEFAKRFTLFGGDGWFGLMKCDRRRYDEHGTAIED